jgi:hypothetical protein
VLRALFRCAAGPQANCVTYVLRTLLPMC